MRHVLIRLFLAAGLSFLPAAAHTQGPPPHAWLFGAWSGGMFPPPPGVGAEACQGQPVVIFTRDIVMRATIADQFYVQRLIVSAATASGLTEFRFTPASRPVGAGVLGLPEAASLTGFGCANPDWLPVRRLTADTIEFPKCTDFPYPLRRCPGR